MFKIYLNFSNKIVQTVKNLQHSSVFMLKNFELFYWKSLEIAQLCSYP